MENFRTPNFRLVAEILDWLVHRCANTRVEAPGCAVGSAVAGDAADARNVAAPAPAPSGCRYDPHVHIPESIDTEAARIQFLAAVAAVMASKARIALKTKSLYAADGRAVKELLKVARTLHR